MSATLAAPLEPQPRFGLRRKFCLPESRETLDWRQRLTTMIPSFGQSLADEPDL